MAKSRRFRILSSRFKNVLRIAYYVKFTMRLVAQGVTLRRLRAWSAWFLRCHFWICSRPRCLYKSIFILVLQFSLRPPWLFLDWFCVVTDQFENVLLHGPSKQHAVVEQQLVDCDRCQVIFHKKNRGSRQPVRRTWLFSTKRSVTKQNFSVGLLGHLWCRPPSWQLTLGALSLGSSAGSSEFSAIAAA